jgi:hypothetical protein
MHRSQQAFSRTDPRYRQCSQDPVTTEAVPHEKNRLKHRCSFSTPVQDRFFQIRKWKSAGLEPPVNLPPRHERLGVREHTRPACRFEQLSSARASKAPTLEGLHARRVCSFTMSRHELGVRRPHPRPQTEPHLQKPFQSAAKALQQINRIGSLVPFTIIGGSATDTESEERVPNLLGPLSKYKCGTGNGL